MENKKTIQKRQMSEALINGLLLAFSGGFQDAYTYFVRDHVFSNAQTGNVVLMSEHFMAGEWGQAVRYLFPLLFFTLGVFVAEQGHRRFKYAEKLHWRQGILLAEIAILFGVGFIPTEYNSVATCLVSFSCAMQVQAFRKIKGYGYASTMCIGNLRSGTEALAGFLREKNKKILGRAFCYYGVIFSFAVGAGIGGILSLKTGLKSIWVSCFVLSVSFLLMFVELIEEEIEKEMEAFIIFR
jgi:uncharacterized membrane protein YoaK (UPF0700 family)